MGHQLISSPLQGFTDFRFRNAFQKYFGGIDTFYAPYIRLNGKFNIKASYQRDLDPKNNQGLTVIPQIMTNSAEEFLFVAKYVKSLGYDELNWNLGCPYPMVTKRGMGSGLICEPVKIDDILNRVFNEADIKVSMKMRMGYETAQEILTTLPVLDKYPLQNISIHARIGKQLYKGGVDLQGFEKCLDKTKHPIYYNGDITTVSRFNEMVKQFPSVNHWLIGRGLIADPFLPQMIKKNTEHYPENKLEVFRAFHQTLLEEFAAALSGDKHIIMKMTHYWEYFETLFPESPKAVKKIKKTKKLSDYDSAVDQLFEEEYQLQA
ncbi:MAG: tRNA dihydrouridine synthase [Putridiphycobacter sp.]